MESIHCTDNFLGGILDIVCKIMLYLGDTLERLIDVTGWLFLRQNPPKDVYFHLPITLLNKNYPGDPILCYVYCTFPPSRTCIRHSRVHILKKYIPSYFFTGCEQQFSPDRISYIPTYDTKSAI